MGPLIFELFAQTNVKGFVFMRYLFIMAHGELNFKNNWQLA